MTRERIALVAVTLTLAVFVGRSTVTATVGAAPQQSAIPDKKGLIHACYKKAGGALRVIDTSVSRCTNQEIALTWHQKAASTPPSAITDGGYSRVVKTFTIQSGYTCTANANTGGSPDNNVCILDTLPLATQPVSMDCIYKESGVSNGQAYTTPWIQGCPGFLTWQGGRLQFMVLTTPPERTYKSTATITVQYEAVYKG